MSAPPSAAFRASWGVVTSISIFLVKEVLAFAVFMAFSTLPVRVMWLSFISIMSSRCSRWGSPPPMRTAFLSK